MNKSRRHLFIASSEEIVARSDKPNSHFLYTPSVVITHDETILVSNDVGGNLSDIKHFKPFAGSSQQLLSQVHVRHKGQQAFKCQAHLAMGHTRLFCVGKRIYMLGHNGFLQIAYSEDEGQTWSELHKIGKIPEGWPRPAGGGKKEEFLDKWHGSACGIVFKDKRLYLCMERREDTNYSDWNVAGLTPHVLSAPVDADLTDPSVWKISRSFTFSEIFHNARFAYFGLPFQSTGYRWAAKYYVGSKDEPMKSSPMGWLEGNMVEIRDPDHIWHDPTGRTLYLFLRCNTAGVGYAAILKVIEDKEHELYTELVRAPSGEPIVFLPFPGGHNKFYILYDDATSPGLYWMASTQAYDSMTKMERVGVNSKRFGLPNNERHRLVLHFSKNCVDWIFAGVIAIGKNELHARNYPSMCVNGEDLLIAVRSGDDCAKDSQYTNLITLYTIHKFRDLVY